MNWIGLNHNCMNLSDLRIKWTEQNQTELTVWTDLTCVWNELNWIEPGQYELVWFESDINWNEPEQHELIWLGNEMNWIWLKRIEPGQNE